MSTEIGTLRNTGSRNVDMNITRYYGGKDKGVCVQLTAEMEEGRAGYVQLSAKDLRYLISILDRYIVTYSENKEVNTDFEFSEELDNENK
jgi:hypothetical protein